MMRIICVLAETVSRGDGANVCYGDEDAGPMAHPWIMLADVTQCRRLTTVIGAARVAVEVLHQPVVYVVRDVHLAVFYLSVLTVIFMWVAKRCDWLKLFQLLNIFQHGQCR